MRRRLIALTRDPLSLLGSAITTASAVIFVSLFAMELAGFHGGPYIGILAYLILPALFLFGLVLIPLGIWRGRRRARRAAARGEAPPAYPVLDFNLGRTRSMFLGFLILSLINVVILATATYKGVEVMDSTEFCGATCHTVMEPEYTAYQRSPHSRVACVDCHIGPGAGWFAKSKLSGAWQVVSVAFDLYPRPIPTPVHDLRPARETCEQCHWPSKFVGDRLVVRPRYDTDEENTRLTTALLMRIGGRQHRESSGIHWHVDPGVQIRYRSDPTRETIYDVELTRPDGSVTVYRPSEPVPDEIDGEPLEWRLMDCVDCHNRPTHVYRSPAWEMDLALDEGRISGALPFVRREGARLLEEADYPTHEAAAAGLAEDLAAYYRENHPEVFAAERAAIEAAGAEIGRLYGYNVFPEMNVGWDTYPNHIGHEASPGCFRCHNDDHAADDGSTISQDCLSCHELLAIEEQDPEILASLGI